MLIKTTIQKILIANRGEIARRVIKTCERLGIATVAVYSDPDEQALFVKEAGQAVSLGGVSARESYLDTQKILKAAKDTGADAIHPGYGFLSENAAFAKDVAKAGLIFIGPKAETITKMGSKRESKDLMKKAGVPVIPGYQGKDQSTAKLIEHAKKIGLPCMVKASAGGGGKGLKRVDDAKDLKEAIESAKREGKASFGDDTLLIEKFIESPRHIEVQVFGDSNGNVVHLGERDCSLQRRHQKVLEEAPSPFVDEKLRKKITDAAVLAAKTVDYVGAGTVEFVVGEDKNFYFLEMNTRLQVEHPVTEAITGFDLVEWQIHVANGEALPVKQKDISFHGHAIEVRLYAEDPYNQFLPVTGDILRLDLPTLENLRYDMGVQSGDSISPHYDPMIGKVIAYSKDRVSCIHALHQALKKTVLLGTTTNLSFLQQLLEQKDFVDGACNTTYLDSTLTNWLTPLGAQNKAQALIAATLIYQNATWHIDPQQKNLMGFQNIPTWRPMMLTCDHTEYLVLAQKQDHTWHYKIQDQMYPVTLESLSAEHISFNLNGQNISLAYVKNGDQLIIQSHPKNLTIQSLMSQSAAADQQSAGGLTAPLPGKVLKILVKPGQKVSEGDTLMIVEAMKMEHPIKAFQAGTVKDVFFAENDNVKLGDVLLEV